MVHNQKAGERNRFPRQNTAIKNKEPEAGGTGWEAVFPPDEFDILVTAGELAWPAEDLIEA